MSRKTGKAMMKMDLALIAHVDGQVKRFEHLMSAATPSHTVDGYRLRVAWEGELIHLKLQRLDKGELDVDFLEFEMTTPLLNYSKIILPDSGREYLFKSRACFLRSAPSGVSAPNDGFPFLAFTDQAGKVSAAFGLVTHTHESRCYCVEPKISARKAMLGGVDWTVMRFRAPTEGWRYGRTSHLEETVFVGEGFKTWFHALRAYSGHFQKRHKVVYPDTPGAWEPTWCTWTAWCSDLMTVDRVMANAKVARELGMGAVILDDGWFGPGLDTDDRPLNIGDYEPDPAKIPDLKGLIGDLQAMGLKVLLWHAPTCLATTSLTYGRMGHHVIHSGGKPVTAPNGFQNLCPCNPDVRRYICQETARMLDAYGADGFKVDLYNTLPTVPCDHTHEHDEQSMIEGVRRLMREMWEVIIARKPDALVELKQNYANPIGAQYGTMVRAGDTAYDIDTNLERCGYIQAYGAVVHNDYLACSTEDSPRDVGIMMIKMLTSGVPTFSLDLPKQSSATLGVIRAWLRFYRDRLNVWKAPREPQGPLMDVWQMGTRKETVVSAVMTATEVQVPKARVWWLLNGTGRTGFYLRCQGDAGRVQLTRYDESMEVTGSCRLALRDRSWIDVAPGGCVKVELLAGDKAKTSAGARRT